jgi:hypothetical protein
MPPWWGYENDCLAIVNVQFLFTPSLTKSSKVERLYLVIWDNRMCATTTAGSWITWRWRRCDCARWRRSKVAPIRRMWRGAAAAPVDGVRVGGEVPGGRKDALKAKPVPVPATARAGRLRAVPSRQPHPAHAPPPAAPRACHRGLEWFDNTITRPVRTRPMIARCQVNGGKRPAARCRRSHCGAGKRSDWPRGRRGCSPGRHRRCNR